MNLPQIGIFPLLAASVFKYIPQYFEWRLLPLPDEQLDEDPIQMDLWQ